MGAIDSRKPRICMLTARNCFHTAFRGGNYEAEDVLTDIDAVDLMYLKPGRAYELRKEIQKKFVYHDFTKTLVSKNMAFQPIQLTKEYDLFVTYMPLSQDLVHIPAIRGWKDHCRTSICWIDEIWAAEVPRLETWLSALSEFDHVFISLHGTVDTLSRATARPWHFMPVAVDAVRFSPYPKPPERVIDVYSIGRKSEGLHRSLLEIASKKQIFYVYDTFSSASSLHVANHREHREMLANTVKRSRYFVVAPAKLDAPDETRDQIEVGLRYFEAAAGGAVMIGQTPVCESFRTLFDWPDAVIEVQSDGSDIADVLARLSAQPERLLEISRRNATQSLLRHDWVYRWRNILRIVGIEPAPEMEIRENKLKRLAEQIEDGGAAPMFARAAKNAGPVVR